MRRANTTQCAISIFCHLETKVKQDLNSFSVQTVPGGLRKVFVGQSGEDSLGMTCFLYDANVMILAGACAEISFGVNLKRRKQMIDGSRFTN